MSLTSKKLRLDTLMSDIALQHSQGSLTKLTNVKEGCACLAMYSEDGSYYRGVVVALSLTEAEVFFVDYGNKVSVNQASVVRVR